MMVANNQKASLLHGPFPCYLVCTENDRRQPSGIYDEELT
jgi:hypothetical protein